MPVTYSSQYNGLRINTNQAKGLGCETKILDKLYDHLRDITSRHSKVMMVRFDLHYPKNGTVTPDPEHLHNFHENLIRDLKRNNPLPQTGKQRAAKNFSKTTPMHDTDPRIIKVTEQHGKSPHPHVHGVVLVNGNVKKSAYDIQKRIERQWSNALQLDDAPGLIDHCDQHGPGHAFINRNSPEFHDQLNNVYYRISYLAKVRGKENKASGSWSVPASRIPKQNNGH